MHIKTVPLFSLLAVTPVHGRTFSTWTSVTCILCLLSAFNLDSEPLFLATFLSFFVALLHFTLELLVYKTMAVKNVLAPGFFAGKFLMSIPFHIVRGDKYETYGFCLPPGTSMIWMFLHWRTKNL